MALRLTCLILVSLFSFHLYAHPTGNAGGIKIVPVPIAAPQTRLLQQATLSAPDSDDDQSDDEFIDGCWSCKVNFHGKASLFTTKTWGGYHMFDNGDDQRMTFSHYIAAGSPDFKVALDGCSGVTVHNSRCSLAFSFTPSSTLEQTATFTFPVKICDTYIDDNGQSQTECYNDSLVWNLKGHGKYPILQMVVNGKVSDGSPIEMIPSVKKCGVVKDNFSAKSVEIKCIDKKTLMAVPGCQFMLSADLGDENGGHVHNYKRPFVLSAREDQFLLDQMMDVDGSGSRAYTAPEPAGDVQISISGIDPWGHAIDGTGANFRVKAQQAVPWVSLVQDGLTITTDSHPGEGIYGTARMKQKVAEMIAFYRQYCSDQGLTCPDLDSKSASLKWGGVFDISWERDVLINGKVVASNPWGDPHCGHRDGRTIDLSLSIFDAAFSSSAESKLAKKQLEKAAIQAGFKFTSVGERPVDTKADHWHAKLN